jgi:tetratricopeptide (TPR) repeat protein
MVRNISSTPSPSITALQENPHTKIYLPSSPRQLFSDVREPLDAQGYSTATKVALAILGGLVFLYFVGLIHRIVIELDSQCNSEAEKCYQTGLRFFQENNPVEAKKMFDQALGWYPSSANVKAKIYIGLGEVSGDNTQAIDYFTKAIDSQTQEWVSLSKAHLYRANRYEAQRLYKLALQDLEEAWSYQVVAHKSAILFGCSVVYHKAGNPMMALGKCKEALKATSTPENTLQYLNFALDFLVLEKDAQRADMLRQRAAVYFTHGEINEALTDLNVAIDECTGNSEDSKARLLQNRSMVLIKLMKPELALIDLERASKLIYDNPDLKKLIKEQLETLQKGLEAQKRAQTSVPIEEGRDLEAREKVSGSTISALEEDDEKPD